MGLKWLQHVAPWLINSPSAKAILLALAFRKNDDTGLCCPSLAQIECDTCLCRDAVCRAILKLERCGAISVQRFNGRGSKYTISASFKDQYVRQTSPSDRPVSQTDRTSPSDRLDQSVRQTRKRNQKKKKESRECEGKNSSPPSEEKESKKRPHPLDCLRSHSLVPASAARIAGLLTHLVQPEYLNDSRLIDCYRTSPILTIKSAVEICTETDRKAEGYPLQYRFQQRKSLILEKAKGGFDPKSASRMEWELKGRALAMIEASGYQNCKNYLGNPNKIANEGELLRELILDPSVSQQIMANYHDPVVIADDVAPVNENQP